MAVLSLCAVEDSDGWKIPWYSNPGKYNLEIIGSIDLAGSYEFCLYLVLKDLDGNFWWTFDSGCSCPIPFEDTWELQDLNDYHSWIELRESILTNPRVEDQDGNELAEALEFLMKVEKVVPGGAWDRLKRIGSNEA